MNITVTSVLLKPHCKGHLGHLPPREQNSLGRRGHLGVAHGQSREHSRCSKYFWNSFWRIVLRTIKENYSHCSKMSRVGKAQSALFTQGVKLSVSQVSSAPVDTITDLYFLHGHSSPEHMPLDSAPGPEGIPKRRSPFL